MNHGTHIVEAGHYMVIECRPSFVSGDNFELTDSSVIQVLHLT